MKDSYSFDRDQEGLQGSYQRHREAYARIYDRCGLDWYECVSDVGMMGGTAAHEYMAPCPAGEDDVVLGPNGYSSNLEIASADPRRVGGLDGLSGELHTPGQTTIDAVAVGARPRPGQPAQGLPGHHAREGPRHGLRARRPPHRRHEARATRWARRSAPPATTSCPGPAGFLGPTADILTLYDAAVIEGEYVAGANKPDQHAVVTIPAGERVDVRAVEEGDTLDGVKVRIEPAIEIGNIFQLGTRYSEPLGCTYLDEHGKEHPVVMGSYGIGPARVAAAAVEQFADEKGISWPKAIAPWDVEVVALGKPGTPELAAAEALYDELGTIGLDVLLDDRTAGPGEKFADAELLGVPLRLTVGRRSVESGAAEAQIRRGRADHEGGVPLKEAAEAVQELWRSLP